MFVVHQVNRGQVVATVSRHRTLRGAVASQAKAARQPHGNLVEFGIAREDGSELDANDIRAARDALGLA